MKCVIDDCRNEPEWLLESYPDDVLLCRDHVRLHDRDALESWERLVPLAAIVERGEPS